MKISEVPSEALAAKPTPIPTKTVFDWELMYKTMLKNGFVVIESDKLRLTTLGAEESVYVKMFNSYVRSTKNKPLRTKRISKTRWFCCL